MINIFFTLYGLLMFFLSAVLASPSYEAARIRMFIGKVEIQRAGTTQWTEATLNSLLFNNDKLRTASESRAEFEFEEGGVVVVAENSKVLINTSRKDIKETRSKSITTFYGVVFFMVEKTLPKNQYKIYTPTIISSIRGSSFGVTVEKESGTTKVWVMHGKVLVASTGTQEEIIIQGGDQTTAEKGQSLGKPAALSDSDYVQIKTWIGEDLFKREREKLMAEEQLKIDLAGGRFENKILWVNFLDLSGYSGKWDIQKQFPFFIAEMLKDSVPIPFVYGSEYQEDPEKLALKHKARFVVTGQIALLEIDNIEEIEGKVYRIFSQATVKLIVFVTKGRDNYLVKKIEKEVVVKDPEVKKNTLESLQVYPFNIQSAGFRESILGKAVFKVCQDMAKEMRGLF